MSATVILLLTFLVSMVPVIELKGAIPMGVAWAAAAGFELSPWAYFAAAFLGSCIPAFLILPFLRPVLARLGRTKLFAGLSRRLDAHFAKKAEKVEGKAAARAEEERRRAEEEGKTFSEEEFAAREEKRRRRKEFFKYFSVFVFVCVPLPMTGIWTGSAIAAFLNCKSRWALPCIVVGNLIAGLIIMLVTLLVGDIFGLSFGMAA